MRKVAKPMPSLVTIALVMVLLASGCGEEDARLMEISPIGFSMKLPPEWKQGKLIIDRKKRFSVKLGKAHFLKVISELLSDFPVFQPQFNVSYEPAQF